METKTALNFIDIFCEYFTDTMAIKSIAYLTFNPRIIALQQPALSRMRKGW